MAAWVSLALKADTVDPPWALSGIQTERGVAEARASYGSEADYVTRPESGSSYDPYQVRSRLDCPLNRKLRSPCDTTEYWTLNELTWVKMNPTVTSFWASVRLTAPEDVHRQKWMDGWVMDG